MIKGKKFGLSAILCVLMALCVCMGVMFAMPTKAFATKCTYTTYENWQIKHEGSEWQWTENLTKVEEGLFKMQDAYWTGSGFNVGSDANPIKKDWFAPEELTIGEEVKASIIVDVYLRVIDDETLKIGVGVAPAAPSPALTVTVADILPQGFPSGAPVSIKNGWTNGNSKIVLYQDVLYLDDDVLLPKNKVLTESDGNYVYIDSVNGKYITFYMKDGVLEKINLFGFTSTQNGDYVPQPTIAEILVKAESGFPTSTSLNVSPDGAWVNSTNTSATVFVFNNGFIFKDWSNPSVQTGPVTTSVVTKNGDNYQDTYVNGTITFNMSEGKLVSISFEHLKDTYISLDGTYTAPAPVVTVADILPDDFPTSDDGNAPLDAWVNSNNEKMFSCEGDCYIGGESDGDFFLPANTELTKDGNNYKCTKDGATVTFVMSDNALVSIIIEGLVDFDKLNGTYSSVHVHSFTYSATDNVLTATCDNADGKCELTDCKLTLTLTAPISFVYDGNPKAFTFADGEADEWKAAGLELPTITYNVKQSGQSTYLPLLGTLKSAGDYMAQITVDGKTASVQFRITQAEVTKPQEDTTVFTYTGSPITYNIAENDLYTISGNVQTSAGNYTVTVSLKDNYEWADGTTEDLTFEFVINKKAEDVQIKDENEQVIENSPVSIIDAENGIAPDAILVVKVVNVKDTEETDSVEKALIDSQKIAENEKIYAVYDVKLLINDIEVQPDGKLTVKMLIPQELRGKEFKLYHIHASSEIYEIYEYSAIDAEGYVTFEIDKLSEFAFVADKNVNSLSAGAIVGIVLGSVVFVVLVVYVLGYFFLYRKGKLDDKKIKVIYKFLPKAK